MFPASCKVVHVVCVFPAEEIRVRLFMFFKSEALTAEEGKEQKSPTTVHRVFEKGAYRHGGHPSSRDRRGHHHGNTCGVCTLAAHRTRITDRSGEAGSRLWW